MSAGQVFSMSVLVVSAFLAVEGQVFGQDAALPPGVKAVWEMSRAHRDTTPTREQVCINGLWRWQPAKADAAAFPAEGWGFFKVPGCWPGVTDYIQKDCQTLFTHPSWRSVDVSTISTAWYQREIVVPKEWDGRRITLYAEYVNSSAAVFLDGKEIGTILFPSGEVDLTAACRPGAKQLLSLRVKAMPFREIMMAYIDTAHARQVRGTVERRGLCGDVYLIGAPKGARITGVKVDTSVRKWEITFHAALDQLQPGEKYTLKAVISDGGRTVKEFTSEPFTAAELANGRESFTTAWKPEKLWDIHTPRNMYSVQVSLNDAAGKVLDVFTPERFGFREFWIDGRDFYLNGTRIYLSSIQFVSAQMGAAWATYDAVCEALKRLKSFGVNYIYMGNYGCDPGTHLSFAEMLRAADDMGMLVGLSQPHFSAYDWRSPDAEQKNGYARHAAFYVGVAGNHPSVVFYVTSHNACGYNQDMNPDLIDGAQDPRDESGQRQEKVALRAEAIIRGFDQTRIVYHHAGGNIGAMDTINFYLNWCPIQEMDEWFEHWATVGVKPLFTCEFGVPYTWDWAMYRGWYKGRRTWGSADVPWEFCIAEWNAQTLGDPAYRISEKEKANLRWEAEKFRDGELWHRWDYPYHIGERFDECYPVLGMYLADNWRAFRTLGMSANSPSEFNNFWKPRDGVDRTRKELKVDWENLQRPGLSADYIDARFEGMDVTFERTDWIASAAAQALYRNNMPLLAYIAGKPTAFTSKDHNFLPAQTVEKQVVVINNSRETVSCDCSWSLSLPSQARGAKQVTVPTGSQERIPIAFALSVDVAPGAYEIALTAKFSTGETQKDTFVIDVLPAAGPVRTKSKIALFDPMGETAKLLKDLGVEAEPVGADDDLAGYDVFIVGKGALTPTGAAPDISRVRKGLKVILFEQTSETLEKRFGFRTAEYGLRWVFRRMSDHPLLAGLTPEHLRNWCGASTILPPRLTNAKNFGYGGLLVQWCDLPLPRVWRCGNRGDVASVLIEKPGCGNFLPILDGGFSLQYSPLMEYREGAGMVLFCQMDVTGRTEKDPAAEALARNIVEYAAAWKPSPARKAVYGGEAAGQSWLESAGIAPEAYGGGLISPDEVLIVGPGGAAGLKADAAYISAWLKAGGQVLAMALDEKEAGAFLPGRVRMKKSEHIAAYFDPFACRSLLAGVGPADVHSREPRQIPLVAAGATPFGDGVLALGHNIVFSQLAPWQYDNRQQNVKRTFRHVSFLTSRLLGNMGVSGKTPLLERFHSPVAGKDEKRFLKGFYLDVPVEWDDPYRFFRW
jgi:hypothetical protein